MSMPSETSRKRIVEPDKLEGGVVGNSPISGDDLITPDDEKRYITGLRLYCINTALIVSMFLVQMDSSMLALMHHFLSLEGAHNFIVLVQR